ncbi:MAG: hypothetical protein AAF657_37435, partial [Acidobacteriota bacterium]
MRRNLFLSLLFSTFALAASPLSAVTWSYNGDDRVLTAALDLQREVTISMPAPQNQQSPDYLYEVNDKHYYSQNGKVYCISFDFQGASVVVTLESTESWSWVRGPVVNTSSDWRRVDVSRYGEAKGFAAFQKASYLDQEDLWIWAFWQPETSHGAAWKFTQPDYNPNSGKGNMILVPDMLYPRNTSGQRQSLFEQIEIRVGDGLWDAVPTLPTDRVSQWATYLADTVFIDSWSHDTASDLAHLLQTLQRVAGEDTRFFTNWASWGSGGHAGFLPDSLWTDHDPPPPYLPNYAGYGSLDRMRDLAALGEATGWLAFRVYYSVIRDESPSYQAGLIRHALQEDGTDGEFSKRTDWPGLYMRQEADIQMHLGGTGSFSDSLSIGFPWNFNDHDAAVPDGLAMHALTQSDKDLAQHFANTHGGPVTGEGVSNEVLIGPWIATGEYNMHNGRGRRMTPEYKLRRLQGLTTFHGMGLNYRFTDISNRWSEDDFRRNGWRVQGLLDDYRATQLLFGNGGFIYAENHLEDAPWGHYLSEVLMVVPLQRHFALQPVTNVEYETSGQGPGTWRTLEQLVEDHGFVMETNLGSKTKEPFEPEPQSPEFERIRVTYANGLQVVANRGAADFTVVADGETLTLPPTGWAAWGTPAGQPVLAYSAYAPGTSHRIDYLQDDGAGVRFVDPRGGTHFGVQRPTQWVSKNSSWRRRLEADLDSDWPAVTLEGQRIPLRPARRQAADSLDTDFTQGFGGWRTMVGARTAAITTNGLELDLAARTPILHSPQLALDAGANDRIEVDL